VDKNTLLHQERFTVRSFDVDLMHHLKINTLCSLFQEVASNHARQLDVGYEQLRKKNMLWVLSRLLIRIHALPTWHENITLKTWAKGTMRLFAVRDFELCNEAGGVLCQATSYWLMLDANTYRPIRPDAFFAAIALPEKHALPDEIDKIELTDDAEKVDSIGVRYTDLDQNWHVNNVQYINWVLNCFPPQQYERHALRTLQINFLSEFRYEDEVQLYRAQSKEDSNTFVIMGRKAGNKEPGFAAKIHFQ
jgi:acyl-ACP thioesterase